MNLPRFKRRLNFTTREYQEVLARMETRCGGQRKDGRGRERFAFSIADIPLRITHPEGGTSHFLVFGRNISRSGISVLHGGFVHPGSDCRLVLSQTGGSPIMVGGEVRHCRLFAGSCHEVGIHFHAEIDPSKLAGSEVDGNEADATEDTKPVQVSGTILVAESFAPDHFLLQHHLSVFGLDIVIAETPGALLDSIKRDDVDLVLFGLRLGGRDGLRTIEAARKHGFTDPIIVLTAEMRPHLLDAARQAGATSVISKPFDIDFLVAKLRMHLGSSAPDGPIVSTAANQPGMSPLIRRYVDLARRTAAQVERTYVERNWDDLREYCCQLKGSGCGYGFQNVTVAAMSVLNALDGDVDSKETRQTIQELLACCRLLDGDLPAKSA